MTYLWSDINNNYKTYIFKICENFRDNKHIFQCDTYRHFALFFNVTTNVIISKTFSYQRWTITLGLVVK